VDLSILQWSPAAHRRPRDPARVRAQLREALEVDDAPTVVPLLQGAAGPEIEAVDRLGTMTCCAPPAALTESPARTC